MRKSMIGLSIFILAATAGANPVSRLILTPPASLEAVSANGRWRALVVPANDLRGKPAQAFLFRVEDGRQTARWAAKLGHPVLPQEIRISDHGQLITLDRWEEPGIGPEVAAIYGEDGSPRKTYALEQILPSREISRRVGGGLFSRTWRDGSADWFSADGQAWVLRLAWGKVLRFELSTGEFTAVQESSYAVRRTAAGGASLYALQDADGRQMLVPCAGIDASVDDVFSVRVSSREMQGIGRLGLSGSCVVQVQTRYNPELQERQDVYRATGPGKAVLRLSGLRDKAATEIPVTVR